MAHFSGSKTLPYEDLLYHVEIADTLEFPDRRELGPAVVAESTAMTITDTSAGQKLLRIYRVRLVE
jgi:hypothetical protein